MEKIRLTRRTVVQTAATAALAAPFVRGAHAAGKLAVGFWDHWVPGANDTLTKLCTEWADKEKVEIKIDYITSQGEKLNLTQAAEAQARSGHDILTFLTWAAPAQADNLEPVDELMAALIKDNGKVSESVEYVAKQKGHWIAVPATVGSPTLPPCARIDLFKEHVGLDLPKMYPAGAPPDTELAGMVACVKTALKTQGRIPSACRSVRRTTRSIGWKWCCAATALSSSTRKATSPSIPTQPSRCSSGSSGWCRCCRGTSSPGMIRATTRR
jgi:hypothetical protein